MIKSPNYIYLYDPNDTAKKIHKAETVKNTRRNERKKQNCKIISLYYKKQRSAEMRNVLRTQVLGSILPQIDCVALRNSFILSSLLICKIKRLG